MYFCYAQHFVDADTEEEAIKEFKKAVKQGFAEVLVELENAKHEEENPLVV